MPAPSTATSIAVLQTDVERLSRDVQELTKTITVLVEHDVAIRTVIRLGTWIGALVAGVAGLWATWHAK